MAGHGPCAAHPSGVADPRSGWWRALRTRRFLPNSFSWGQGGQEERKQGAISAGPATNWMLLPAACAVPGSPGAEPRGRALRAAGAQRGQQQPRWPPWCCLWDLSTSQGSEPSCTLGCQGFPSLGHPQAELPVPAPHRAPRPPARATSPGAAGRAPGVGTTSTAAASAALPGLCSVWGGGISASRTTILPKAFVFC